MKNVDLWRPTKYIIKDKKLVASKDPRHLVSSSWLIAQISANFYSRYLKLYCKGELLDLGCGNVPIYGTYKEFISNVTCAD